MSEERRATLRQIVDALAATRSGFGDPEKVSKLYERARTMRDRGLIKTSARQYQGKVTLYSEADVVAAVVALTASLNGGSSGIVEAMNSHLRKIGNTQGRPEFEAHLEAVKAGAPIFIRLDLYSDPFPGFEARMGSPSSIEIDSLPDSLPPGTTRILVFPVTAIAKPVLDRIFPEA